MNASVFVVRASTTCNTLARNNYHQVKIVQGDTFGAGGGWVLLKLLEQSPDGTIGYPDTGQTIMVLAVTLSPTGL